MTGNMKLEEYLPLALFVVESFSKDRAELAKRFPQYDDTYLADFQQQIQLIKQLEDPQGITENLKNATKALYDLADSLSDELRFTIQYLKKSQLDPKSARELKDKLDNRNIEGAVHDVKAFANFLTQNSGNLVAKGMAADYPNTLNTQREQLITLNTAQNNLQNIRAGLTSSNREEYNKLYAFVSEICEDGKLLFEQDETKVKEYTISALLRRMRSA